MLNGTYLSVQSKLPSAVLTLSQFKTNKGRIALMGEWPWKVWNNWTLLDQPSHRPGRIFYDTSPCGIRRLGFETPAPALSTEHSLFPRPLSKSPRGREGYFYTSATLDGITMVTPSLHHIAGTPIITGLIFHHSNEHTSCVGQVRLNSLGRRFDIDSCLWLGFASTDIGGPSVIRATNSPSSDDSLTLLALPCHGLLEWWFSFRQCKLHHQGRESPTICWESPGDCLRLAEQKRKKQGIRGGGIHSVCRPRAGS